LFNASNNFTKLQDDIQFHNNKSINGILSQNTVYHDINKNNNNPGFPDLRKAIDKHSKNEKHIHSSIFPTTKTTTMFRASASNHRQHKHLTVDFVIDTRSINMLSLYKSSELQTKKMFLNILKRGPIPPQKVTN